MVRDTIETMTDRNDQRIEPGTASGFRDFLPADAAARQRMASSLATTFERFGFQPIDTPSLERIEVLAQEGAMNKQLFRARLADDQEDLGLRFDLTVPLARYVAAHAERLSMPFRRYHIGKVWRGEHAQAGRFREFVQADADIVGAKDVQADAEIIALMYQALADLGAAEVTFRIGHRKVLDGLMAYAELDSKQTAPVLRSVDKLEKIGWEGVRHELTEKDRLSDRAVDAIRVFLEASQGPAPDVIKRVRRLLEFSGSAHEGIDELEHLLEYLDALQVPKERWELDLSIARGLGYYTGPVFETRLNAVSDLGSICSGGRYDSLVERFAPMELSATGASIGLDRLFIGLDRMQLVDRATQSTSVAVLNFHEPARRAAMNLVSRLRARGVPSQMYLGSDDSLRGQLSWAVKHEFSVAVIIGSREFEDGICQVKNILNRSHQEISLHDAPEYIASLLSS